MFTHQKHRRTTQLDVVYTWSPLEDPRLFGPSPWQILAATNEQNISEQPSPWRKSSKRKSCDGDRVNVRREMPVDFVRLSFAAFVANESQGNNGNRHLGLITPLFLFLVY